MDPSNRIWILKTRDQTLTLTLDSLGVSSSSSSFLLYCCAQADTNSESTRVERPTDRIFLFGRFIRRREVIFDTRIYKFLWLEENQLEMEDWEDVPVPDLLKKEQPASKWDDEDADDDNVKESWEDEEEPAPAPKAEPPAEKAPKKSAAKASETKGKEVAGHAKEAPLDPVAEKLRQQRLVEEADYKSTAELFAKKGGDDKTLDNFIPKSESDFLEYAELISHKLRPYEKSYHYIGLLKAVMRLSMTAVKGADAKEISSSVTAIANEKIKAEKEANASKKKTGAKKKQLHVDKADDEAVVNAYDGYDDYDFM
ncbi:hypothetical protein HAX54_015711 [Datura stramonium]|uniref:Eukaryotic translation initiation factor 3 subunit J n=1 Tax=Datura stramonium TaxID=4076 RepID=A0ABS8UJW0_DATST|nr:hypothetical protein [Datura stramonium]